MAKQPRPFQSLGCIRYMYRSRSCRVFLPYGRRSFSTANRLRSGHNRWSTIKHDKAKADASTSKQRMAIAKELANASKSHGPDPRMNPRLATVISAAKKMGTPKATIEKSIAIGQGISLSGATLENVMVEAMIPPSVALIIECQTDSKKRTLENLRYVIHKAGGSVAPTSHLFKRKGRIVFEKSEEVGQVEAIDLAIEVGALDVDVSSEDGNEELIVLTEPTELTEVANALAQSSGLNLKSSDIIWDPREDLTVNVEFSGELNGLVERIYEEATVQEVYTNAR